MKTPHLLALIGLMVMVGALEAKHVQCRVGTAFDDVVKYRSTKRAQYCRITTFVDGSKYSMRGKRGPLSDNAMSELKRRNADVSKEVFCYTEIVTDDGRPQRIIKCFCQYDFCNKYLTLDQLYVKVFKPEGLQKNGTLLAF